MSTITSTGSFQRAQFVLAGHQNQPRQRICVGSHVHLPDCDAYDTQQDDTRRQFISPSAIIKRKALAGMRLSYALVALVLALVVLGFLMGARLVAKNALMEDINAMNTVISDVRSACVTLNRDLVAARDSGKICYRASNKFEMISADSVPAILIDAPDPRPDKGAQDASSIQSAPYIAAR